MAKNEERNEEVLSVTDTEAAEAQKNGKQKKKNTFLQDLFDIFDAIIVAIVAAILILSIVFRTGYVDGPSMTSTMMNGDRYIVSGLFYTPEAGDVVVLQPEAGNPDNALWVKRVIATEGQEVNITETGEVYVDNKLITEPYLDSHQKTYPKTFLKFPMTVPPGHVFVMGDNRLDSKDSRNIGCIDARSILGKVLFRFYPLEALGPVE